MTRRRLAVAAALALVAAAALYNAVLAISLGHECDPEGSSIQIIGSLQITHCHSMIRFGIAIGAVGVLATGTAGWLVVAGIRRGRTG